MIPAVLDTNVLVCAFPAGRGIPARLLDLWRRGAFALVVSEHTRGEIEETWRDPYWRRRFSPADVAAALGLLRRQAVVVPITAQVSGVAAHPEDDLVLATAESAGAAYLVTGDRRQRAVDRYHGITIPTARLPRPP